MYLFQGIDRAPQAETLPQTQTSPLSISRAIGDGMKVTMDYTLSVPDKEGGDDNRESSACVVYSGQ